MADEAIWCAMEATDEIKVEGTEMMPTAILDRPKTGGVKAMRTGKGKPLQNAGNVARKATRRASAGRSAPIQREPGPEIVPDIPTREIESDRTTLKDP